MPKRSSKPRNNADRRHIDVFMSLEVHQRVKEAAAAADLPLSTWFRHAAVAAWKRWNARRIKQQAA